MSDATPDGADEIDFAALIAEQEQWATSRRPKRRGRGAKAGATGSEGSPEVSPDETGDAGGPTGPSDRPRRSRWWSFGFPVVAVLLAVSVPLLSWAGLRVILDSSDGQLVKRVTDPNAPGYEAVVTKTPTDLALLVDANGKLDTVLVFALTGEGTGGVILVPAATLVGSAFGQFPISQYYALGGLASARDAVGTLLNLGFSESQEIPSTQWATLVGPTSPLTVTTPDAVTDAKGAVVFPKGSQQLTAAQAWTWLSTKGPKESDLNRLFRTQTFLKAWFAAVAKSSAPLPIDQTSGLGKFVSTLARDPLIEYQILPVTASVDKSGVVTYTVQAQAAQDTVASMVPFPDGAPGARLRLRVLDGTGQLSNGIGAAIVLNAAGGQTDVVGNAKSFGQQTTQFIYFDGVSEKSARALRDALGMGELVSSSASNSASDVTVILGADYLAAIGGPGSAGASASASSTTAAR